MPDPLSSPEAYQAFVYTLPVRYPSIQRSTLVYIASGNRFGRLEGIISFAGSIVLCVLEILNFDLQAIASYGYEISRSSMDLGLTEFPGGPVFCKASYPLKEKLYWYDSFPHPHISALASTHPHHKHIPPNIRVVPE